MASKEVRNYSFKHFRHSAHIECEKVMQKILKINKWYKISKTKKERKTEKELN